MRELQVSAHRRQHRHLSHPASSGGPGGAGYSVANGQAAKPMRAHLRRYRNFIASLPPPGGGGAHHAIYGAGCAGFRARLPADQVIRDVRENLPAGGRHVPDEEIEQGVTQAYADMAGGRVRKCPPLPSISPDALPRLLAAGMGATVGFMKACSPVPLNWPAAETPWRVLDALYDDSDLLFIGDDSWRGTPGDTIRTKAQWVSLFRATGRCPWPKIMVNPLTGQSAPKRSGGTSFRADACIKSFRFVVAEFDGLPLDHQLAFWAVVPHLPVAALIHSGKKSIHAWLRVDCSGAAEWASQIEQKLFPRYLQPLGLDPACKNESRLSRMPGHRRQDTGLVQDILYLAPQGKAVSA